jgi:hypothetical protein
MNFDSKDFEEFKNADGAKPTSTITQNIFARVNQDLNPSAWRIFGKLSLIHFFVAAVTLSICPQFGIRLLGDGMGLMEDFMRLGDYGCPVACGAFFMGTSIFFGTCLLTRDEIRVLRQNQILEFGALTLLSLGAFVMFHAEIAIGFAVAWFLGTLLGSSFIFEVVRLFRSKFFRFSF